MVLNGGKRLSLFWMSFCTAYISHQIVGALYGPLLIAYTVRSPLFSVVWTETYIIGWGGRRCREPGSGQHLENNCI